MKKTIINNYIKNKNILFLQGPIGYFFKNLQDYFKTQGVNNIYQIGFNYGDEYFSKKENYIPFKEDINFRFEKYIKNFYIEKKIKTILLIGEYRLMHRIAIKVAKNLNIKIIVFEEGYIRPNFITMELNGVNANSNLKEKFIKKWNKNKNKNKEIKINKINDLNIKKSKSNQYLYATIYSILTYINHYKYKDYQHHKNLDPWINAFWGIRSYIRNKIYSVTEKNFLNKIKDKKYFFIPLQIYNDFQVIEHSKYFNIEEFIEEVIKEFSKVDFTEETFLIFKHHPMGRGIKHYGNFINYCKNKYKVKCIFYIHDVHLPTLLKNAKGVISINSTVGLSSLYHGKPTLLTGENTMFDIEDISNYKKTYQEFFLNPQEPNKNKFNMLYNYIIQETQVYGDFYQYNIDY
jgi:capsular polysaccharide export protein